ncbi:helix-turn-helix transcriptional regulator [Planctomycetota bacterium]
MTEHKTQTCQLLSAKQLAKMLSLSPRTVWRLLSAGKLPKPIQIGGSVRWELEREIKPWLQAGAPDRKTWEQMKGVTNE